MSRITVLLGGSSSEREVSLATGKAVAKALESCGHEVDRFDSASGDVATLRGRCDLVFIALHGGQGEDGRLQARLDDLKLPYTGSGPEASQLAMDKWRSKSLYRELGMAVPEGFLKLDAKLDSLSGLVAEITERVGFPAVAKPNREGSSVGLAVLSDQDEAARRLPDVLAVSAEILIERYVSGREITASILGDRVLPLLEIVPESGLYDFEAKYSKGKSKYTCPADLEDGLAARIAGEALAAFRATGCRHFGRVDFRLDRQGLPHCLEVNTIPGMTATSLVPMAAAAAGLDFPALVAEIASLALGEEA